MVQRMLRTVASAVLLLLVSGPVYAQTPSVSPSGTIVNNGDTVSAVVGLLNRNSVPGGFGTVAIQITGTFTGTIAFEGSVDCLTYVTPPTWSPTSATAVGLWQFSASGLQCVRARATAAVTGTATIYIRGGAGGGAAGGGGSSGVTINDPNTPTQKAAVNGSGQLSIVCANCSGSGASAVDEGAFTQGTNTVAPAGGLFKTVYTALSSGQAGIFQMTSDGALYANIFKVGGTAVTLGAKVAASSFPVVLASDQATLPVSIASLPSGAVTNAGTFAVQAAESGTWNVTNVSGTVSLPTGAATAAKQPALGTAGSASTDVLTVQGIASGTALPMSAASLPLPTGAATSAIQTGGSQKTQIVDGSGNVIASTSNNLNVQCANCSGSGASAADNATVTESTSTFAPAGGEFQTTPGTVTTGHQSMVAITAHRAFQTSLFDAAGNALLGSKVSASSIPIVIASDQGAVPVSIASLPSGAVTNAGTFAVQATESGTWNITNVSGTVSLPTLASTSTKQSDGSQKTQIVDGSGNVIASTSNNLNVQCANCSGSGASAADNATVTESTSTFAPMGGEFQTTPGTVTTGHQAMAAITAHRALEVSLFDTAGNAITQSTDATTNTASQTSGVQPFLNGSTATPSAVGADGRSIAQWGDTVGRTHITGDASMSKLLVTPDSVALPANQSVNISQMNGVTTTMGNGVSGTGVQRVTLASDSAGQVVLAAGAATIGALTANQSVNAAQINGVTPLMGNGVTGTGSPRVTLASDTTSNTNPLYASAVGTSTTAAASGCYLTSAASTNATSCKGSAGNFYGFRFVNTTATIYYLRMYNTSSAPTCSSATGYIETIPIPASATGAGVVAISDIPINYSTGIGFCFTGGSSSTDNTNAATGVFGAVIYK